VVTGLSLLSDDGAVGGSFNGESRMNAPNIQNGKNTKDKWSESTPKSTVCRYSRKPNLNKYIASVTGSGA